MFRPLLCVSVYTDQVWGRLCHSYAAPLLCLVSMSGTDSLTDHFRQYSRQPRSRLLWSVRTTAPFVFLAMRRSTSTSQPSARGISFALLLPVTARLYSKIHSHYTVVPTRHTCVLYLFRIVDAFRIPHIAGPRGLQHKCSCASSKVVLSLNKLQVHTVS